LVGSSSRYQDTANQFDLAGYAIINFVTTYKINDDWSVQGRVNNLLDKQYALATSASTWGLNDPVYNTPGSNLFVSLRYSPSF
jgi:vitamin B12 transporter